MLCATLSAIKSHFLNEGPRSKVYLKRTILWNENHQLDPQSLDEDPRPKSGKSRLNLDGTILKGKSIGSNPKRKLKKRAHDLKTYETSSSPR